MPEQPLRNSLTWFYIFIKETDVWLDERNVFLITDGCRTPSEYLYRDCLGDSDYYSVFRNQHQYKQFDKEFTAYWEIQRGGKIEWTVAIAFDVIS